MSHRTAFFSRSALRAALTFGLAGATALVAVPACSSGDDFSTENTGGKSNTGGSAGDASTTGGSGGGGGASGSNTGGVAGTGTGGVAGTGTGGAAGSGSGGVSGSSGSGGTASGGASGSDGGSGKENGKPCANGTECKSSYCVDQVCCESDCKGDCRSCKVSGKEGFCTPYSQGTDPEGDCVGAGTPTDPCAGTCDGKSACTYPDSSKSCGAQACASATQSNYSCSSTGSCTTINKPCDPYQCSGNSCLSNCTADTECISSNWCNTPKCVIKAAIGGTCPKDSACQSSHCVAGLCCPTACDQSFTCESGSCKCNGQTCAAGASCITYYADVDGDGFGDPNAPALGCSSPAPAKYVLNKTDCDDGDNKAFPGQTNFFDVPRKGKGGYDYNCDGNATPFYANVSGKSCGRCAPGGLCSALFCNMAWGCNPAGCSGDGPAEGYFGNVACGQSGTLQTCADNPGVSGCQNVTGTVSNKLQPCL